MINRPITDLLLSVDVDSELKYHSRKFICKVRDIFSQQEDDHLYAFYREFP